jgi:hypothetical protein
MNSNIKQSKVWEEGMHCLHLHVFSYPEAHQILLFKSFYRV